MYPAEESSFSIHGLINFKVILKSYERGTINYKQEKYFYLTNNSVN